MRLALLAILLLSACTSPPAEKLEVGSDFEGGGAIPQEYTCEGKDTSLPVNVRGVGKEAQSLALIMEDPDAPGGTFTHWVAWNLEAKSKVYIPPGVPREERVREPIRASQGVNDFGSVGYRGPCPPEREEHRYVIKAYALDRRLGLKGGASREELESAMEGHILAEGELTGFYGR